jgi:hypothetical protein
VRWLAWARSATLFNDGPRFLAMAQALQAGAWPEALRAGYHPLYPLAVDALQHAVPDWESAAALVSIAAATASVALLFLFLRDAFGRPAAWAGTVLLAVHSRAIDYGSDVQSDGLYAGLFMAGLWLGWRAIRARSTGLAAAAGLATGLAYATRPEALELGAVLGALALIEMARGPWISSAAGRFAARDGVRWLAALGGGAALVIVPYALLLERATGTWSLTPKRSVAGLVAPLASLPELRALPAAQRPDAPLWSAYLQPPPATSIDPEAIAIDENEDGMAVRVAHTRAARAYAAAKMLARTAKSSMRYGVLALVLLGLAASRGQPGPRGRFLGVLWAAHFGLLYVFTLAIGYVSRRHTLPALLPALGYAGLGAAAAGSWIEARARALRGRAGLLADRALEASGAPHWSLAATLLVAAVAAGELTRQIPPRRREELAGRRAAEWLHEHAPAVAPVAATRLRLGYYAGMPYVPLEGVADAALGSYLTRAGARYVVLDAPERVAAVEGAAGLRVRELHHLEVGRGQAWVFELAAGENEPAPLH